MRALGSRARLTGLVALSFALVAAGALHGAAWGRAVGVARTGSLMRSLAVPGPSTPADGHDPGDDVPGGPAVTGIVTLPFSADRSLAADAVSDTWDRDFYRLSMVAGRTYRVTVTGEDAGWGEADPILDIGEAADVAGADPGGWTSLVELGDARTDTRTADAHFTARTSGVHYVWVQDDLAASLAFRGGGYRIHVADEGTLPPGAVERVDGVSGYAPGTCYGASDRYSVAAALAERVAAGVQPKTVVIASGLDRAAADALASGGLSGAYGAPILLVRGDGAWARRLPAATAGYLVRLKRAPGASPIDFMIAGGPASVPESLKSVVLSNAPAGSRFVARFGGADRYEVAAGIAARVRSVAGTSTVFIANGQVASYFSDALAVSALCARSRCPLLLTKATVVPAVTLGEARRYAKKVLVGDDRAIQAEVFSALGMTRDATGGSVTGGDWIGYREADWGFYDRFRMARLVAEYGEDHGMAGGGTAGLANALMDALGGGAAVGRLGGVMLFTDSEMMDAEQTEGWLVTHRAAAAPRVLIVGGVASVEPGIEDRLRFVVGVPPGP